MQISGLLIITASILFRDLRTSKLGMRTVLKSNKKICLSLQTMRLRPIRNGLALEEMTLRHRT